MKIIRSILLIALLFQIALHREHEEEVQVAEKRSTRIAARFIAAN